MKKLALYFCIFTSFLTKATLWENRAIALHPGDTTIICANHNETTTHLHTTKALSTTLNESRVKDIQAYLQPFLLCNLTRFSNQVDFPVSSWQEMLELESIAENTTQTLWAPISENKKSCLVEKILDIKKSSKDNIDRLKKGFVGNSLSKLNPTLIRLIRYFFYEGKTLTYLKQFFFDSLGMIVSLTGCIIISEKSNKFPILLAIGTIFSLKLITRLIATPLLQIIFGSNNVDCLFHNHYIDFLEATQEYTKTLNYICNLLIKKINNS